MKDPILFHFDFSSPYGYLASEKIEALARRYDRSVDWRPILLGVVFRQTGAAPLTQIPLKGDYARRDMLRSARFHDIANFRFPSKFPIATQAPARMVLWTKRNDPPRTAAVVHALYRAFFAEDHDISDPEIAADAVARIGLDRATLRAAVDDPALKDALRHACEEATAAGVFGSPYIVVDGEPFWGLDRLDQVERWLATDGF